jgi:hypothetical protein
MEQPAAYDHAQFATRVDAILTTETIPMARALVEDWTVGQKRQNRLKDGNSAMPVDSRWFDDSPLSETAKIAMLREWHLKGRVSDDLGRAVAALALRDFHPSISEPIHRRNRYYSPYFANAVLNHPEEWGGYFAALEAKLSRPTSLPVVSDTQTMAVNPDIHLTARERYILMQMLDMDATDSDKLETSDAIWGKAFPRKAIDKKVFSLLKGKRLIESAKTGYWLTPTGIERATKLDGTQPPPKPHH